VSPTWVTFLFEAANFLLLAAILGWLFFRPVRSALERRQRALADERSAAAQAKHEAEQELEQARARRAEFERSAAELREQVRREAEGEGRELVAHAREQAERDRARMASERAAQRRSQAESVARDGARAACEIVSGLLARIDGPALESALLAAASAELERLHAGGSLAPLIVESARPADAAALETLARAAGIVSGTASTRHAPELIAGYRVLTARGLVDVSAAGLAAQAERSLLHKLAEEPQPDGE